MLIASAPVIDRLLTPEQKRKLPALVASYLDTRYLAGIRSGTAAVGGRRVRRIRGAVVAAAAGRWRRVRARAGDRMRRDDSTLIQTSMHSVIFARRSAALLSLARLLAPSAQRSSRRSVPQPRPLGAALATSEPMGAISAVRQLPGGRLLVNDPRGVAS
jgi:hypothetical protein